MGFEAVPILDGRLVVEVAASAAAPPTLDTLGMRSALWLRLSSMTPELVALARAPAGLAHDDSVDMRAVGGGGGGGLVGIEGADGAGLRRNDVPLIVRDNESDAANDGGLLLSAATSPRTLAQRGGS